MAKSEKKPRVAVDSGLVISHVIGDLPQHANGIQSLFHEVDSSRVLLYGSTLLLTEVLGGSFQEPPNPAKENQILSLLENPNVITLAQVTRQVAMTAREFRRRFRLKSPDAIHLATAVFVGANAFMTTDEDDFPIGDTVHGVKVLLPGSALGADVLPTPS